MIVSNEHRSNESQCLIEMCYYVKVCETLDRIVSQYKQSDNFVNLIAKLTMNCDNLKMHAHDLVIKFLS